MLCVGFLFVFSCSAPTAVAPPAAARYCETARPITWSAADTAATRRQIIRENRKWLAICKGA